MLTFRWAVIYAYYVEVLQLPARVWVYSYAVASFLFTLLAYSLVCVFALRTFWIAANERVELKRAWARERCVCVLCVWSTYIFVQQIWALLKYLRFARFDYTDLCFISMLVCYVVWWHIRISSQLKRISTFQKLNKAKPSKASALSMYTNMLKLMSVVSVCRWLFLCAYARVCVWVWMYAVQVNRHSHFRNTVPAAFLD